MGGVHVDRELSVENLFFLCELMQFKRAIVASQTDPSMYVHADNKINPVFVVVC